MKFYIGLGGIGCRTLRAYSNSMQNSTDKEFFYIDSDLAANLDQQMHLVPGIANGSSMMRRIGHNSMIYDLFVGNVADYFSQIQKARDVEFVFVVSSFGGFGSAAIFPLMDYLESIAWKELKSCEVIAFNENAYKNLGWFPQEVLERFESNTLEFVNELLLRENPLNVSVFDHHKVFNPSCHSFLIDTQNIAAEEFWKFIDQDNQRKMQLDCKEYYYFKPRTTEKPVFISYSSKDQAIADVIVKELMKSNIEPWIASKDLVEGSYPKQIMQALRNASVFLVLISKNAIKSNHVKNEVDRAFDRIKDGMIIIPFLIDDAELDDELNYYLCRQEMISGTTPPMQERVNYLVDRIQGIVTSN